MADTETPSSASTPTNGSTRVVAKRVGTRRAPRKRVTQAAKKSGKAAKSSARKSAPVKSSKTGVTRKLRAAPGRNKTQTAAIIAVAAAAATGAVYALRRLGWVGKAASLALLNKDVRQATTAAVKSLVEKTGDFAEQAGQLAGQTGRKAKDLLSR